MAYSKVIERLFYGSALACATWCLLCGFEATALRGDAVASVSASLPAASGTSLGRIEIPALALTVPVVEDDDTKSLLRGLGHIRGTAMLGGLGTTALAGHRDTFLRPIRRIKPRMEILAISGTSTYHYLVDSTEIVDPSEIRVLDIQDEPEMVLVTCYPFDYIGAAPKRFIVHAHLVSVAPEQAESKQ